jgi:transketolase
MLENNMEIQDMKDTRSGFGAGLLSIAEKNPDIFALCADLTGSVKMDAFKKTFPDRFVQIGIAEANMVGIAAGLALSGKIPFIGSFAAFATGRVYDQIRVSVAYSNLNVKIAASHAGLTLGEDGATHQIMEDIGLMKGLPNMVVINPCDYNQTCLATIAAAKHIGPVYLRFGRPAVPNFTSKDADFQIGKAILMKEGADVSIFATGHLVFPALEAAEQLKEEGISAEVINIHTIKPIDTKAIIKSVTKTKCVVTAEEHLMNGGLGDSICQLLALYHPTPVEMIAVDDKFGESGSPMKLMEKYGLDKPHIIQAVKKVINRKV